mmetsp:Transcript_6464/g.10223  ORF Transcript_6464/g.10223 Transcript_6464/m.10223 type:complete len:246 (-) Transcript_6464:815-1552(-)
MAVFKGTLAVASGYLLAFMIEQGGTVVVLTWLKYLFEAESLPQVVEALMSWSSRAGFSGAFLCGFTCTILQLLPICNGILMAMMMGAMWGTGGGLLMVSSAATLSAFMCYLIARNHLSRYLYPKGSIKLPELLQAVSNSIASSYPKSLFVVSLFRLSPVIPFCWSNYLFGLTPIKSAPYFIGTWLGTLPALSAFVSAGVVGKAMISSGASPPALLLALGGLATFGVLSIVGSIAKQELDKIAAQP